MAKTNYEIVRGTITTGAGAAAVDFGPGETIQLEPADAAGLVADGVLIAAGSRPKPKSADARIKQLEAELQAALAASPDAAALKTALDAKAEGERLLAASKEANALTETERDKALADLAAKETELVSARAELDARGTELADARLDLQKAAEDFAALQEEREADEAKLAELGFTRDDEGNLVAPAPPPAEQPAEQPAG